MLKKYLFIFFVLSIILVSKGTHIIGGYMHYDKVGVDKYKVTMTVYKDCQPYIVGNDTINPWGFDNIFGQPGTGTPNAVLTVYSYVNGVQDSTGFYFTDVVISDVKIQDPDSCRNIPSDVCVQKGVYSVIVDLPDITDDGYYLSYQRCCRNPSSINVDVNGNSTGITVAAYIPKLTTVPANSNPNYSSNPPIAFCLNNSISHDLSAYDDDGDSLAYELTTPLDGSGSSGFANPVIPPPYSLITYQPGYSDINPITGNPSFELDPVTGLLTGRPVQLGAFIVGFKVLEYRNSILISETIRDLRFYVLDCGENFAEFDVDDHICDGIEEIDFISYSSDVNSYLWEFGETFTIHDTSTVEFPSYIYTQNGEYLVSLTTNVGSECEDVDTHSFVFRNSIDVEIEQVTKQCFEGNSFNFEILNYDFPIGTSLDWTFGPNASQSSATGLTVSEISYSEPGVYEVSVTAVYNQCETTSTISIEVFPEIDVSIPDILIGCLDQNFTVKPDNIVAGYSYSWSLGGTHVSNEASFIMLVDTVTVLDLELVVTDANGCVRTISKSDWLHIKNQSIAEFEISDTIVFVNDLLDITNYAENYTSLEYDFGNGDVTIEENPSYMYDTPGIYTITQVVDNGGECPSYYYKTVDVRYDHYIYFPNVFTPNGDGTNDTFFPVRDGIKSYSLEIYDRWGKKVYNGVGQKKYHEWNGIYESGEVGAEEVYNYFCTYITEKEDIFRTEGVVLLLK